MKKSASPEKTVLETILAWSEDRPAWQRDALRRIVAKGRLDAEDHRELIDLCKQGRGGKDFPEGDPSAEGSPSGKSWSRRGGGIGFCGGC
jgi:hypothetical protein